MRGNRMWGDGATDARAHVIADISYRDDYIVCRCGALLRGIGDGTTWGDHGGKVFSGVGFEERGDLYSPTTDARVAATMRLFERQQARCTCARTDVTECPNYQPGDEEVADGTD